MGIRHTATILLLAGLGLPMLAQEVPLFAFPPPNSREPVSMSINPGLGTLLLYETMNTGAIHSRGYHSFLADRERLAQFTLTTPNGEEWSLLRTGSGTTSPSYVEWLGQLATENRLGTKVIESEDAFWRSTPDYDGVVRFANTGNGVIIVLPGTYTILYYSRKNWELGEPVAWRNYRPDLMVNGVMNSVPTLNEVRALVENLDPGGAKLFQEELDRQNEEAEGAIQVGPSDPWITYTTRPQPTLLLFDPPNKRVMCYDIQQRGQGATITLRSVRDLTWDLRIPVGVNTNKADDAIVGLIRLLRANRYGEVDSEYLRQLAASRAVASRGVSEVQFAVQTAGPIDLVAADFTRDRKVFIYKPFGAGGRLELASYRDYGVELGAALVVQDLQRRANGIAALARAKQNLAPSRIDTLMSNITLALLWNPSLHEEITGDRRLIRAVEANDRWPALLEKAQSEAARLKAEHEAIMQAVQARREAAAAARGR